MYHVPGSVLGDLNTGLCSKGVLQFLEMFNRTSHMFMRLFAKNYFPVFTGDVAVLSAVVLALVTLINTLVVDWQNRTNSLALEFSEELLQGITVMIASELSIESDVQLNLAHLAILIIQYGEVITESDSRVTLVSCFVNIYFIVVIFAFYCCRSKVMGHVRFAK